MRVTLRGTPAPHLRSCSNMAQLSTKNEQYNSASAGLSEQSSSNQLGKTESMTKLCL